MNFFAIQSFLSSGLVAVPRLKNSVCPKICLQLATLWPSAIFLQTFFPATTKKKLFSYCRYLIVLQIKVFTVQLNPKKYVFSWQQFGNQPYLSSLSFHLPRKRMCWHCRWPISKLWELIVTVKKKNEWLKLTFLWKINVSIVFLYNFFYNYRRNNGQFSLACYLVQASLNGHWRETKNYCIALNCGRVFARHVSVDHVRI